MIEPILPIYSYIYDIFQIANCYIKGIIVPLQNPVHTVNLRLIGSRLSAKTYFVLRTIIEASFIPDIVVGSTIIRYEPQGATQTFDELISIAQDIYNLTIHQKNTNITRKSLKIGRNKIKAIGVVSNKKRKQFKLGIARQGAKKDLQINFIEESTEFDSPEQVQQVLQSIGGSKFTINIWASNPWVSSMWYVKQFVKRGLFKEKILRSIGSIYEQQWDAENKTLDIWHITNHRVNTYLSEGQHASLTILHKTNPHFAMITDLGMPGISEGLIYAPILHLVQMPIELDSWESIERIGGGLDWGTSTGVNGSAVSLTLGKIGRNFKYLQIEQEYYHSNSQSHYKNDNELIQELLYVIVPYAKENLGIIRKLGQFRVYVDNAAIGIATLLENELLRLHPQFVGLISFWSCYKYKVPVRIDVLKHIISTKRLRYDKSIVPQLHSALERAQWDDTKMVDNRPTRLKEDDDPNDSLEYFINNDLMEFADANYIAHNKLLWKGL